MNGRLMDAWAIAGDVLSSAYCFGHVLLTAKPVVTIERRSDTEITITEDFFRTSKSRNVSLETLPQAIATGMSQRTAIMALKALTA